MSITVKPVGKGGLLRQVMSYKRFNSYEMLYDRTRKRWPFNIGDCLIKVTVLFVSRKVDRDACIH
jgi:hypothetical protein